MKGPRPAILAAVVLGLAYAICSCGGSLGTVPSPVDTPSPTSIPPTTPPPVDYSSRLVEQARRFFASYTIDEFTDWQVLESAADIPAGERVLKHPQDYQDVISAPQVIQENSKYRVMLYTWTGDMGMLARWELTVEGDTLIHLYGRVVDILVGDVTRVRTEGSFLPTPNKVITNERKNVPLP